jgi:hypothetical protein
VWRVHVDEATKFDASLTEGCNRDIDVLLVFVSPPSLQADYITLTVRQSGLFSTVQSTFIIQPMIPDLGETTIALLAQLVAMQAHSGIQVPPLTIESQTSLCRMHWVNGLWFTALTCSLSTALISMLAKQWLQAYTSNISGSLCHRSRSRHIQLETRHVLALINSMPLLLDAAVLLSSSGLIVLLWSVDLPIAILLNYRGHGVCSIVPLFGFR